MAGHELKVLFKKEWRQLLRSKGALATALLLPTLILLVIPSLQILGFESMTQQQQQLPKDVWLPPGIAALGEDPRAIIRFLMPLFITIGGLIVPMMSANYTLIAEREARTLELLVALPVSMSQVMAAKLGAIVVLTTLVTFPLFAIDAVLLLATGTAGVAYVLALFVTLVCALAFSTAGALLIGLIARDFRTGNNLNALLVVPAMLLVMGLQTALPSPALGALIAGLVMAAGAGLCAFLALKVVTFERLLR